MLEDVVADFLDSVTEREFDAPFLALLRAHGFSKIHLLHGMYEFGKDAIAQRVEPLTQYGFQTKAGDISLPQWTSEVRGQVDVLRTNDLAHPDFDKDLPRRAILVITGRLVGGAPLEVQNYKTHVEEMGDDGFDVWDRERLLEMLVASPEAGLTGFSDGPFLELLGRIDQGRVTESRIERFSERWIGGAEGLESRALLEAALVANRLGSAQRIDLACFAALCLLRAIWASVHGTDPPSERTLEQREAAIGMFSHYARSLWEAQSDELFNPREIIRHDLGIFVTYPVQCLRLIELLGLYGLMVPDDAEEVSTWLSKFVKSQPGAAHPISDRWAVSLLPAAIMLARVDRQACRAFLTEVLRWLGDRHDNDGLGLAEPHAEPLEEIEHLAGSSLDHVERAPRRHSYLAAVILDFAAVIEDADLYDLAYNEIAALDIRPFVTLPGDDVAQYLATGHGVDVPVNTSPYYVEYYSLGAGWRMAGHQDDDLTRYYLGRVDHLWDHLTLSIVTRDRHWVAGLRRLVTPPQD